MIRGNVKISGCIQGDYHVPTVLKIWKIIAFLIINRSGYNLKFLLNQIRVLLKSLNTS